MSSSINERDQMLFISADEGSSFQRQPVSFTPDMLLFHPKEEDKLLAYCKEGRVGTTLSFMLSLYKANSLANSTSKRIGDRSIHSDFGLLTG